MALLALYPSGLGPSGAEYPLLGTLALQAFPVPLFFLGTPLSPRRCVLGESPLTSGPRDRIFSGALFGAFFGAFFGALFGAFFGAVRNRLVGVKGAGLGLFGQS